MSARLALVAIAAAICLSACGDSRSHKAAAPQLFKQDKAALDKAKGVQQIVDQQAQRQRQQIDNATK
jgi:hypothetical protein